MKYNIAHLVWSYYFIININIIILHYSRLVPCVLCYLTVGIKVRLTLRENFSIPSH